MTSLESFAEDQNSKVAVGKTAQLHAGEYVGGGDIPAGTYVLKCVTDESDSGIVWLSAPDDDLDKEYPSLLYEYVSSSTTKNFYVPLEEGGKLNIPFDAALTSVDYMADELNETDIFTGEYTGGKDLAAGHYIVRISTDDDNHGIIWLSAADDDLEKNYPSLLYEHVGSNVVKPFYITLEDGGKLGIPCDASTITKVDGVNFENGSAQLYAGRYVVGDDFSSGKYTLHCKPGDDHGIVWVAAPGDDLDNSYPSVLYNHISDGEEQDFYLSLEDGGILFVPFECTLTQEAEGIAFE